MGLSPPPRRPDLPDGAPGMPDPQDDIFEYVVLLEGRVTDLESSVAALKAQVAALQKSKR